jgi:hypothetical protein
MNVKTSPIEQLTSALIFLADRCDGAIEEDRRGFNGGDSNFGKSLAAQIKSGRTLTERQAAAGCRLLAKYSKQLETGGLVPPQWSEIEPIYTGQGVEAEVKQLTATDRRCEASPDRESILVYFDYDPKLVATIKDSFGTRKFVDAKGDAPAHWKVPMRLAAQLIELLEPLKFKISAEIYSLNLDLVAEQQERQLARQEKALNDAQKIQELMALAQVDEPFGPDGYLLRDYQKDGIQYLLARTKAGVGTGAILADEMGLGKAELVSNKLLTPSGWKRMGDIAVGDLVIGSDGKPTKVTGVFPQGMKTVYRLTFTDDTTIDCCGDHLWSVNTAMRKKRGSPEKVLSVKELLAIGLKEKSGNLRHYIPMVKSVEFADSGRLPLDPYVLGVLLGDGALSGHSVTWTKPDPGIAEIVRELLPSAAQLNTLLEDSGLYSITGLEGINGKGSNPVLNILRELNLMGCKSESKFIPDRYKFALIDDRLSILQGLLDTDGSCSADGIVIDYGSTSEQLCLDVQFLVESFGGTARMTEREPWHTYQGEVRQGQRFYRLNVSLPHDITPFRTSAKASIYKPRTKYQPTRGIKSIKLLPDQEECQCISVDAPDHLYVTEHCIITHNTIQLLFAAKALQLKKSIPVIVICPVSLRGNWQKEAEMVGVKIETYSWQKQPEPLELLDYVLIADECHYAQNSTSARTKSLMALATYKNCAAVWLATGTPMKNGQPHNLLPLLMAAGHPLGRDPWAYKQRYCNAHQKNVKGRAVWDFTGSSFLQELAQKTEDIILRRLKSAVLKDLPAKTRIMSPVELEPKVEKVLQAAIEQAAADYRTRMAKAAADEREGMADAEAIVALTNARRISSEFKIPRAIEMAQELLENGEPVVIFTEFTDTAEKIHFALKNYGAELLTGATKQADRQGLVDRFQAGTSKVFVGTVKAGGVGITLTAASNLIMVDRPWTPGDAYQAEDRVHRLGQKNAAMIYWLQVSEVDRAIDQLIETKQARIELVLRGKRKTFRGLKSINAIAKALLDLIEPGVD